MSRVAAESLLDTIAHALTQLDQLGVRVKLKHDAVYTDVGYVLPIENGWVARTLLYTELTPSTTAQDDD